MQCKMLQLSPEPEKGVWLALGTTIFWGDFHFLLRLWVYQVQGIHIEWITGIFFKKNIQILFKTIEKV